MFAILLIQHCDLVASPILILRQRKRKAISFRRMSKVFLYLYNRSSERVVMIEKMLCFQFKLKFSLIWSKMFVVFQSVVCLRAVCTEIREL